MLTRVRLWLPDAPGVLGAVAAEIGAVQGNVVGLEVLEREAGVAIDEMVVELPDDLGAIDALCRGVRNVPGVGVEEVVALAGDGEAPDREDTVLAATTAIIGAATPDAVLKELTGRLRTLFGLGWLVVADDALTRFVEVHADADGDGDGAAPSVAWVAAFAEGARSGADPAGATTGSGVFVEPVPGTGLAVCGGRTVAIRRRERREITLLVTAAARFMEALGGRR
ncbi:MAG TPA: hypothetical protein VHZ05_02700 [Acidimicrobiales bacterium]|nr:hypothetical protein [Acidimicrobiales bacterium]